MKYLDKKSLANTIDNVSTALLFGQKIDNNEKREIADFIIYQHTQPRAYADTFAPTSLDLGKDLILFTGEKIKTGAGKCHMIGEEASRILRKLKLNVGRIKTALYEADNGLKNRVIFELNRTGTVYGRYCCNSCSCALWLNIASGGLGNNTEFLISGLDYLKQHRENNGRWKGFPYYYTLYILNEIHPDLAMSEMKYAAKSIEKRLLKKSANKDKYDLRRNYICNKILEKTKKN